MYGGPSGRGKASRELKPVHMEKHLSATSLERFVACLPQEPSQLCSPWDLGLGTKNLERELLKSETLHLSASPE